jgi:hypothetical protein
MQGWVPSFPIMLPRTMSCFAAGTLVRTIHGPLPMESIRAEESTPGAEVPVFNLTVASEHTYFVGEHDFLVHDNALPAPVSAPFDALGPLTASR